MSPTPAVLAAFGARGRPVPLPGGAGTSWRCGGLVLKPLDTSVADLAWQAQLLGALQGRDDVRVAAPVADRRGALVVEGWTARRHLAGEPGTGRWAEVVAAGRRFAAAVASAPRPAHLAARDDPWALGDRAAWEAPAGDLPAPLRDLAALRRPLHLPEQVVHGDLAGNVLLAPGLPPAVIDLSAYWRPVELATAVVVADALLWHGAGAGVVQELLPGPDGGQLLVRAVLFRAVSGALLVPGGGRGDWRGAVRVAGDAARSR